MKLDKLTQDVIQYQKTKCIKFRNKVIVDNIPLIYFLLRKTTAFISEDLVHECVIIFIHCMRAFNYKQNNTRFSAYLTTAINSIVFRYSMITDSLIKINTNAINYKQITSDKDSPAKTAYLNTKNIVDTEELSHLYADNNFDLSLVNLRSFTDIEKLALHLLLTQASAENIRIMLNKNRGTCDIFLNNVRKKVKDQLI